MTQLGINFASEAHGPSEIVEYAARAEEAGFDFAVVSDHFHPWISKQGNSPFVWGTLGGIAERTEDLELGTAVTCPTTRIHPAIVAQAAATAARMLDGRFFLGVGTGENLNEHVLGDRWPPHEVRLSMLDEAVDVIRDLWTGEMVTHHGDHYTVENAKLFTLPEEPPPVYMSGLGPRAAEAAARIADGYVGTSPKEKLVGKYEEGGGDGPTYGGAKICWAESEEAARKQAHEYWPNTALKAGGRKFSLPSDFEKAAKNVSVEDVAKAVTTGTDAKPFLEYVRQYADAGYDHVYLHHTGPNQLEFIGFAERELVPEVD